jgi:[FeFe] hydrogenase H-cluster maturation GTPase HydF
MLTTPNANRTHIAIFGRRNAGKSSLINAITNQDLAIVSDIPGTTTDPVQKAMELLPLGPVLIIDTPGLDDAGVLGEKRVEKALKVLNKTDIAIVVADVSVPFSSFETSLINIIKEKGLPFVLVFTKTDKEKDVAKIKTASSSHNDLPFSQQPFFVSSKTGDGINALKEHLATLLKENKQAPCLVSDLVSARDLVILVVPIDKAAPKGRLILPQQQVLRDLLDSGCLPLVTRDCELQFLMAELLKKNITPSLVITDSQAFAEVSKIVPFEIPLTSFSILFSRYKGELKTQVAAINTLDFLEDGEKILIAEGCSHHRQCDDIGTIKLPKWINEYTKKALVYEYSSGLDFPKAISSYKLIVHCGGCMLNDKEMKHRIKSATQNNTPITNYGMVIAKTFNLLDRSLCPFKKSL